MKPTNSQTPARPEACVGFTNEIQIGSDGWAMIAPFGDFPSFAVVPQPDGSCERLQAIQRIDREGAAQMVDEFQASRKGWRKFFAGRPIYVGHPDVPGLGTNYPDKAPKGVITELAVREDGLYGLPVFTNEGSDLVEQKKLRYFSGRLADCVRAEPVNGVPVFRPNLFISAGLTNQPHLPVQMLNEAAANEADSSPQHTTPMKDTTREKILRLCHQAGLTLTANADDDAVKNALDQLAQTPPTAAFANEKAALEGRLSEAQTQAATQTEALTRLTTERDTLQTAFANERQARITGLIASALTSGQITGAEQADWERRLAAPAHFANESAALARLAPKLKTHSLTHSRGDRKLEMANAAERRELLVELVNEEMTTAHVDYDTAYGRVQKKFPQLFAAMQQPSTQRKKK